MTTAVVNLGIASSIMGRRELSQDLAHMCGVFLYIDLRFGEHGVLFFGPLFRLGFDDVHIDLFLPWFLSLPVTNTQCPCLFSGK